MIISGCLDIEKKDYGFYLEGDAPKDLKNIYLLTEEEHMELIDGQGTGKILAWNEKGMPILSDVPLKPLTNQDIEKLRMQYYKENMDEFTVRRSRRIANGTWIEEDEKKYLIKDAEITKQIEIIYPYID